MKAETKTGLISGFLAAIAGATAVRFILAEDNWQNLLHNPSWINGRIGLVVILGIIFLIAYCIGSTADQPAVEPKEPYDEDKAWRNLSHYENFEPLEK